MIRKHILTSLALCFCIFTLAQKPDTTDRKKLKITRITKSLKIDGELNEPEWKLSPVADKFTSLRPIPFLAENPANKTEVYFLYNDEGIYIGGHLYEQKVDSISKELVGRDGFGNNDFIGFVFDTYNDKINAFEYFVTPLGEQMDAKVAPCTGDCNNGDEDFSWNSVWQSSCKIQKDGWSFEMFIPYAAIRFGKTKIQDWGMNIVRRRQKSGEQLFWQVIDPQKNGFLTQEGYLLGLEDIKPPLRLQFSPYFSVYANHFKYNDPSIKNWNSLINGGMDVKYGINQAFTLDMTLIPDFGQVQTDNRILNLTPFEVQYQDNRSFFKEGTELFSKGDLFYSRRIGGEPKHYWDVYSQLSNGETVSKNPSQSKLINATKISGRTSKGLGIGVLNAVTNPQYATIENSAKQTREFETDPLTNYNMLVLNQSLKHNSSVSLVNTNVWRSGKDYDANVTAGLFDFNTKKNTYNINGGINVSQLLGKDNKNIIGYSHNLNFGKTSGTFMWQVFHSLADTKYDKNDMGYFTNNNFMEQGLWMGLNFTKPTKMYNNMRVNFNNWFSRLVKPIDIYNKDNMYQSGGGNVNVNGQLKNQWRVGVNINWGFKNNDFYEARSEGRVFTNKGRLGLFTWWNSRNGKKFTWGGNFGTSGGGIFKRRSIEPGLFTKMIFSDKFSIEYGIDMSLHRNGVGWAANNNNIIYFSRRNVNNVENNINIKYSFTNKMGINMRTRHYWSKVDPLQFYELNTKGNLITPTVAYTGNVKQNYNFMSVDMLYTWQFAQGSFINFLWKDIGESFTRNFEKGYFKNLDNTISGPQSNSLSLRVIYFLDALQLKKKPQAIKG